MQQLPVDPGPITCAEAMAAYQGELDHPVVLGLIFILAGFGAYVIASRVVKILWLIGSGLYSNFYYAWKGKPL